MFELNPNGDEGAAEATACGDMKGVREPKERIGE
jgi:hypothetical protein